MDRTHCITNEEELAQCASESFSQYRNNGFAKYLTSLVALVNKNIGTDIILTGSTADGTKIGTSDVDVMFCPLSIVLEETTFQYKNDCPCYLNIPLNKVDEKLADYSPEDGTFLNGNLLKKMPPKIFKFSSSLHRLFKMFGILEYTKVGFVHGYQTHMNVSGGIYETAGHNHVDFVPSFRISGSPVYLNAWACRKREWPAAGVIKSVLNGEYYAVSRVAPINGDVTKDFCLSFTKVEQELIGSLSERQLLCLRVLKILKPVMQTLSERQSVDSQIPDTSHIDVSRRSKLPLPNSNNDVITSYHLKTAFFWVCENKKQSFWTDTSVRECVYAVLQHFHYCVVNRFLPHYFVSAMNLFIGIPDQHFSQPAISIENFIAGDPDFFNSVTDCFNSIDLELETETTGGRIDISLPDILEEMIRITDQTADAISEDECLDSHEDSESPVQAVLKLGREIIHPFVRKNEQPLADIDSGTQRTCNMNEQKLECSALCSSPNESSNVCWSTTKEDVGDEAISSSPEKVLSFHSRAADLATDLYDNIIDAHAGRETSFDESIDKLVSLVDLEIKAKQGDVTFSNSIRELCKTVYKVTKYEDSSDKSRNSLSTEIPLQEYAGNLKNSGGKNVVNCEEISNSEEETSGLSSEDDTISDGIDTSNNSSAINVVEKFKTILAAIPATTGDSDVTNNVLDCFTNSAKVFEMGGDDKCFDTDEHCCNGDDKTESGETFYSLLEHFAKHINPNKDREQKDPVVHVKEEDIELD